MFGFEDLKYLFKNEKVESKDIYKQDLKRNTAIVNNIIKYNNGFSQSLFTAWVSNIILRYILFCSNKENNDKLISFEKIHLLDGINPSWHNVLDVYNNYKDISVKYIDFVDYIHTKDADSVTLKICLLCTLKGDSGINDVNQVFYNIKYKKNNMINDIEGTNYTSNCPNCGVPTKINTFGICDHCQELISIYDNVWKITSISRDD